MDKFKDRLAVKSKKSSKEFAAPSKEIATTGRFMQIGDTYGVGKRQPVGTEKPRGLDAGVIPQKAFATCPCDYLN
jgi:hypothetical protein